MFVETLRDKFGYDTPIFTDEILALFSQYTRAYVFRLMKNAEKEKQLMRLDTGVYYIPQETPFGPSVITASDVIRKRYIEFNGNRYGIYGGLTLQNDFYVTTQMTNVPEVITNREASRGRIIVVDGMSFNIQKSRTEITKENADAYQILQLFTEIDDRNINKRTKRAVKDFMKAKNIVRLTLITLATVFPAKTIQNMVYGGII